MTKKNNKRMHKIKTKKQLGGGNNKANIRPGVSGINSIEIIKNNNTKVPKILKKMSNTEKDILVKLQGEGVVKILDYKGNYPIMEKLRHIDFYPEKKNPKQLREISETIYGELLYDWDETDENLIEVDPNMIAEYRKNQLKKNIRVDEINYKYLINLLDAIQRVNNEGYLWMDLKTNNLGISDYDDELYIYDFGRAIPINDDNRYKDLLAFGKFYYNTIINYNFFTPGREYDYLQKPITKKGYEFLIDSLHPKDDELKKVLMNIFNIAHENITVHQMNDIYKSFRNYLINKLDK